MDVVDRMINRAYGTVTNRLRLKALRDKHEKVVESVPVGVIESLALSFAEGQRGVASDVDDELLDPDTELEDFPPIGNIHDSILRLAPVWNAEVRDGSIIFTVNVSK